MLNEKLDKYLKDNFAPFHMPGHKRNIDILQKNLPYERDITEIENFDNLNDPKSIFLDLQEKIAKIYKVKKAIISVNGSTCGILSSIRAVIKKNMIISDSSDSSDSEGKINGKILVQRTCHKSVYNSIEVFNLAADYIKVKIDKNGIVADIDYDDLEDKINNNDYAAVILTSPSYEGFKIDLKRAYDIVKRSHRTCNNKIDNANNDYYDNEKNSIKRPAIILDMAHGAHSILSDCYDEFKYFDVAITSFHKTLSALTPSSAILIQNEKYYDEIKHNMAIFQTSSPSYVILQSIDDMVNNFNKFYALRKKLYEHLQNLYNLKLKNLSFINDINKDYTKILISCKNTNITGYKLKELLYENKIEIEMYSYNYVLLMSSIFDKKESFNRLKIALIKIDKIISTKKNEIYKSKERLLKNSDIAFKQEDFYMPYTIPKKVYEIGEALYKKSHGIDYRDAKGKIIGEYVYVYPPGIPILVPGEKISDDLINTINVLKKEQAKLSIEGSDIRVLY